MKATILNIIIIFLTSSIFGKTQIFKEYDFDKGGFYILGVFSESDPSSIRDSIGEFYTDEIVLLNQFKKDWTFRKLGKMYACGYHYKILVCKDGEILETVFVNLNCEEIKTDEGYFHFDPNLLGQFIGKLKKPYKHQYSFTTIQEARHLRTNILKDTTLIMTNKPLWTEYEGSFRFTYKCKKGTKDCIDEDGKIFKSIEIEILNKYPNEKFLLEDKGGSWTEIEVEINCNKSLSDNFDLYDRDKEGSFEKWKPFELTLVTYSIKKK